MNLNFPPIHSAFLAAAAAMGVGHSRSQRDAFIVFRMSLLAAENNTREHNAAIEWGRRECGVENILTCTWEEFIAPPTEESGDN